jgi:VWFA-related protein
MRWVMILVWTPLLSAQEPRFDARSRLVMIPVTVTDAKGRSMDGLETADFLVFDNGKAQPAVVDTIDTGVAPIALVVAVQSAGISAAAIEKIQKIGTMIQPLITGERGRASLVSFDHAVTWLQDFTNDQDLLQQAFQHLRPLSRPGEDKEARLLDAVHQAIERLRKRPNERRVLLLISESRDRGSETTLDAATVAAQAAGVAVYALTYSAFKTAMTSKVPVAAPRRPLKPRLPSDQIGSSNGMPPGKYNPWPKKPPPEQQVDVLGGVGELKRLAKANSAEALTKATGGAIFPFTREKALEQALQKFSGELHSQYVISFAPVTPAPGYHRVEVRLVRNAKVVIRARPGYWPEEAAR